MTPTVLTVFTSASAFASSKFPFVKVIMASLEIPARVLSNNGLVSLTLQGHFNGCQTLSIIDDDFLHQCPRETLMHKKFSLPTTWPVRVAVNCMPILGLHQWPIYFIEISQVVIEI